MKRLFRIVLVLLGAVLLLFVLTAIALPLIFDKDDLKKAIAAEVYQQTGRQLTMGGALEFSVFPWVAVEVSELSLSNAAGFGDQPFVQIGQARVGVALLPLLRKHISVDEITLDGLELALTVNAQGKNNWDDLDSSPAANDVADAGSTPGMFSSKRVAGLKVHDARVEYDDQQAGSHYRLSGLSMQTGAVGDGNPTPLRLTAMLEDVASGTRADIDLKTTAAIGLETEHHTFSDFELDLKPHAGNSGDENVPPIRIRAPLLSLDLAAQTVQMDTFTAELAELRAEGVLSARQIIDAPAFEGKVTVAQFSPDQLMRSLHIEVPVTADAAVLQQASFSASLSGDTSRIMFNELVLQLDQSRFDGELSIADFADGSHGPRVGFQLAVDAIDLDRYLEPSSNDSVAEDIALPQEELQGLDVQGQLTAGTLRLAGLEFSNAQVGVTIRNGAVRLNPLTAGFYGGSSSGDITLDSSGAVPVLSLDEKLDSITFQKLVAALVDNESLSGTALGHVRLTGRGKTSSDVLSSLQGDLGLTLAEGALEGINIWYEIRRGMALYKGLPAPDPEPKRTVFSRLQMDASVADGVVTTQGLVGELPFLTVRGKGAVDLGKSLVDLAMVAEVRNAPELSNDPLASGLTGKSLPFKITGSLDDPKVSVDWQSLLRNEAAGRVLDKLGLKSKADPQEADDPDQEQPSEKEQLEKAAKEKVLDLFKRRSKDKEEE